VVKSVAAVLFIIEPVGVHVVALPSEVALWLPVIVPPSNDNVLLSPCPYTAVLYIVVVLFRPQLLPLPVTCIPNPSNDGLDVCTVQLITVR